MRKGYQFSEHVQEQLKPFKAYMKAKGYAVETIRQMSNYAGVYLEWLQEQLMEVEQISYRHFMDYVEWSRSRHTTGLSRRMILAVRHYYESLELEQNPAAGVYLRGQRNRLLHDIVPYETIVEAWQHYTALDDRTRRNKVMLGILICQGISSGELRKLRPEHVKLTESCIYIPSHGKTNARVLPLLAEQLLDLQTYIELIRPRMLNSVNGYRPGRKPDQVDPLIQEQLFFSESGSANIKSTLMHLFRAIRKSYPQITTAKVIRTAVIAHWLKSKDVRHVQYMAGHRYVSSTERYDVYNVEELRQRLEQYHPLR